MEGERLEKGVDESAQVSALGTPTYAAYIGGSACRHVADPGMIELIVKHGGWIDAASGGYLREVEIARRMLTGELDPPLDPGTFSGPTVPEAIPWRRPSGRSPDLIRHAPGATGWPRDD